MIILQTTQLGQSHTKHIQPSPGYPSIHPSIHPSSICWSLSQLSPGERQGSTWTSHQSITGPLIDEQPCTQSLLLLGNLDPPFNLTCTSLDCGRKLENLEETHSTQKGPRDLFLLRGNSADHQATVLPSWIHTGPKMRKNGDPAFAFS